MKQYLEIVEQLTEEEKLEKLPEMIRVEVTDEADAKTKMEELKNKVRNSKCYLHMHYHSTDATKNKPCELKELE